MMAKYVPFYTIDAEVQVYIYTSPAPTEKEWAVGRGTIDNFTPRICTERANDTPIKVYQRPQTDTRATAYLTWDILLKFADTPLDEMPVPLKRWVKDERRWNDEGRFVGGMDALHEVFAKVITEQIKDFAGGDIDGVEFNVEIHGGWPNMRLRRVQERSPACL